MQLSILSNKVSVIILLALSCSTPVCRAQTPGSVSGRLQTEDGKPVEGAWVMARPQGAAQTTARPVSSRSGADGSFAIAGLPKGRYDICVRDRKGGLLDPCRWSSAPPSADLSSVERYRIPDITLKKGRLLQVHLVDDAGNPATAPNKGGEILVGVWQDNGLFVTVPLKGTDAKGRVHAQYVPDDKPLQLSVTSHSYVIADEKGVAADAKRGAGKQIDFPPGDQPINVTFRTTGVKQ